MEKDRCNTKKKKKGSRFILAINCLDFEKTPREKNLSPKCNYFIKNTFGRLRLHIAPCNLKTNCREAISIKKMVIAEELQPKE